MTVFNNQRLLHNREGFDPARSYRHVRSCHVDLDVILADNLFGDLWSDAAVAIAGSLGMLPSASLGPVGADGRQSAL